jgi:hypothetical protein
MMNRPASMSADSSNYSLTWPHPSNYYIFENAGGISGNSPATIRAQGRRDSNGGMDGIEQLGSASEEGPSSRSTSGGIGGIGPSGSDVHRRLAARATTTRLASSG